MSDIKEFIKRDSLNIISDFIKSFVAENDNAVKMKADLEYVYASITGGDKSEMITCDRRICDAYPHIFQVASR